MIKHCVCLFFKVQWHKRSFKYMYRSPVHSDPLTVYQTGMDFSRLTEELLTLNFLIV